MNVRALSDKWQFRRKQRKWLRRKERKISAPQEDTLFSSTEDLLDDHTPDEGTPPTPQSSLMMVSELRKSLTGLDRAVKTYSFMVNEEEMPLIQVEPPASSNRGNFLLMSSACSSFESEEEEENWECNPYPHGGMDNFATGIMDTFESNLLKLKDFQTQSLPDVFAATERFADNVSDVSALSSASTSTVSILDSTNALDRSHADSPNDRSRTIYPSLSPLALNGHTSPTKDEERFSSNNDGFATSPKKKIPDEVGHRPERVGSAGSCRTWESNSPIGSECSERELSEPSPQPLALERLKFPLTNGLGGNIVPNGLDSSGHHRRFSLDEGTNKRSSKVSVTSSKNEDSLR